MDHVLNCKVHGKLYLEKNEVIKQGIRKGQQAYRCKQCMKESHVKHYQKHKGKIKIAHQRYKEKDPLKYRQMKNESKRRLWHVHKEKYGKIRNDWDKKNPEKKRARNKKYKDKAIKFLTDRYVKHQLCRDTSLKASDLPKSLIELKRALLLIKRKVKEMKEVGKINETLEKLNDYQNKKS